jgi:hypothetical protein
VYPIKIEGPTTKCRHIRNNTKIRPFEPLEFGEYPTARKTVIGAYQQFVIRTVTEKFSNYQQRF